MTAPTPDPRTLLPPNATALERALEAATAGDRRIAGLEAMRRAKLDAAPALVPWLLWEYGLGEVLPYLDDPRRAIREGVLWQRLRGTPAGLRTAFSWRGLENVTVEEEESGGVHFAEFMVDTGRVPDADAVLDLIGLSRLAAPARSRLARIFHGWDIRRLRLDGSRLGDALLSDYSGIVGPDGVRLSFGRTRPGAAAAGDHALAAGLERLASARVLPRERLLLDYGDLDGDRHMAQPIGLHSHLFSTGVPGLADPSGFHPRRKFQRAQTVLSEGMRLGDTNTVAGPPWFDRQSGDRFRLSADTGLSDIRGGWTRTDVLERFDRMVRWAAPSLAMDPAMDPGESGAVVVKRDVRHCVAASGRPASAGLSQDGPEIPWFTRPEATRVALPDEPGHGVAGGARTESVLFGTAHLHGQYWAPVTWPGQTSWRGMREIVGAAHVSAI